MSSTPFIGRRESVGFGIEANPGTAVAPQAWQRHLALTLDPVTTVTQNKSAMGRIEDINDSAVTEESAAGSLNGKITDISVGYLLLNMLGSCTATAHPSETTVYDNAFSVLQGTPPSLTFVRSNPVETNRYALGYQSDFELDVKQQDWAQFTSTIVARIGATSTDTAAYATEHEFTSKHVTVKVASNVAGLTGATGLQLKSLKLKIGRKQTSFTPVGTIDPVAFDAESFGVTGSFVLRYTDTTLENIGIANTRQALSIALVNTDVTIGTATNPSLTFVLPQVELDPGKLDNNLDQVLNKTFTFTGELSVSAGNMITATLTNTQNGYAHD
jgi:hypothetical protein